MTLTEIDSKSQAALLAELPFGAQPDEFSHQIGRVVNGHTVPNALNIM